MLTNKFLSFGLAASLHNLIHHKTYPFATYLHIHVSSLTVLSPKKPLHFVFFVIVFVHTPPHHNSQPNKMSTLSSPPPPSLPLFIIMPLNHGFSCKYYKDPISKPWAYVSIYLVLVGLNKMGKRGLVTAL